MHEILYRYRHTLCAGGVFLLPKTIFGHAEYRYACALLWPLVILCGLLDIRRLSRAPVMDRRPDSA